MNPSRAEVRQVPCPECHAWAGYHCWGSRKGYIRLSNHQGRVNAWRTVGVRA